MLLRNQTRRLGRDAAALAASQEPFTAALVEHLRAEDGSPEELVFAAVTFAFDEYGTLQSAIAIWFSGLEGQLYSDTFGNVLQKTQPSFATETEAYSPARCISARSGAKDKQPCRLADTVRAARGAPSGTASSIPIRCITAGISFATC